MGGIPIYIASCMAILLFLPFEAISEYRYLFAAVTIMFIIGIRDDLVPLSPIMKLTNQMIPFLIISLLSSFSFDFILEDPPFFLSLTFTLIFLVIMTNSFNLIDGIDGLAGMVALAVLVSFSSWFYLVGFQYFGLFLMAICGAIISFLIFNWSPSKIIMGDTGALVLGLIISYSSLLFLDQNYQLPSESQYKFNYGIPVVFSALIIPILDTVRVAVVRIVNKQSPMSGDHNHIHHLLLGAGLKHDQATLVLFFFTVGSISLSILTMQLNLLVVILTMTIEILMFFGLVGFLTLKTKTQETPV